MKRTLSASGGAAVYLIAILVNLGVQLLGSVALVIAGAASGETGVSSVLNYALMAALQAGFLISFRLYAKKADRGIAFPVRMLKWYDMLLCLLSSVICVFCFIFPAQWFALLLEKIGYNFSTEIPLDGAPDIILCVIVTVIVAPVAEELVFRGALLTGLTKKFGTIPAILLSGLAFSLMHMNPEQTVYQFFIGCACAYFAISSGSVLASMLLHAGNNLIALILEFTGTSFLDVFFSNYAMLAVGTAVFLAVGITALFFIGRFMVKRERHGAGSGLVFDVKKPKHNETAATSENPERTFTTSSPSGNDQSASETFVKVRTKTSIFANAVDFIKAENALDEEDYALHRTRPPLLGKRSAAIYLGLGLFACIVTWIMVFAINMSGPA